MDDDVIYVAPNGIALTSDYYKQFVEAVGNVVERLTDFFKGFMEKVSNIFRRIKECQHTIPAAPKRKWATPIKMVKDHQVMMRKPQMIRARTRC